MPNKAFLEITNACNLKCSFCHGTKREIRYITCNEFKRAASQLRSFADYLYFHLMGEPLLHPDIGSFFEIARELGFKVILTTNGTLLRQKRDILLRAGSLHKVSISLHCYEVNSMGSSLYDYLGQCFDFCRDAADTGIISVLRLWNLGGEDKHNSEIISAMHKAFDDGEEREWKSIYSGYKIREKIFLEWGERFDWPDTEGKVTGEDHSCYGLRDQIGVLSDGTVVPCCLDAEGTIDLGNIYKEELCDILSSERALLLRRSFEEKRVCEELCRRCGYAKRFK